MIKIIIIKIIIIKIIILIIIRGNLVRPGGLSGHYTRKTLALLRNHTYQRQSLNVYIGKYNNYFTFVTA